MVFFNFPPIVIIDIITEFAPYCALLVFVKVYIWRKYCIIGVIGY
jgi:hypothetical protein